MQLFTANFFLIFRLFFVKKRQYDFPELPLFALSIIFYFSNNQKYPTATRLYYVPFYRFYRKILFFVRFFLFLRPVSICFLSTSKPEFLIKPIIDCVHIFIEEYECNDKSCNEDSPNENSPPSIERNKIDGITRAGYSDKTIFSALLQVFLP